MLRFAADENFNNQITEGILERNPAVDIIRIQKSPVSGAGDPIMLEWVAREDRILLTHDLRTVPSFAYQRIRAGLRMPGVLAVRDTIPVGRVIEELLLLAEYSLESEYADQVRYLPLS